MKKILFIFMMLLISNKSIALETCASINPLYGILANITKDITDSYLILDRPNQDLHSYVLTPSDAFKIKNCDFIFMINSDFENFSDKLKKLAKKGANIIEVSNQDNIKLLEMRENNIFEEDDAHDHDHGDYDYHIWLDIDNAKSIAKNIAKTLSNADPKNKDSYQTNLAEFIKKLDKLDDSLKEQLSAVKNSPFIVFHDAYQYFEDKYQLNSIGAIIVSAEHNPLPKTLLSIKELVDHNKAKCIFAEPQFSKKIIDKIASSSQVKTGVLNAEWADSYQAEEIYFNLMNNLAKNFTDCLANGG